MFHVTCYSRQLFSTTMLVLLMLTLITDSSSYKPCKVYPNKVTCRHNLSTYLNKSYLTEKAENYKIGVLEIINTDIDHLETEWTEGKNNITYLKINYNNKLNNISSDFLNNLKELIQLDLTRNNISTIDNSVFKDLKKLEILNLGYNKLHGLQIDLFSNQQQLKILYLNNNMIKEINMNVLSMLFSLEKLYLNQNSLEMLDERRLTSLENLKILNLSNNNLRNLPTSDFLNNFKELISLDLTKNNISTIDNNVFKHLKKLQYLNLGYNNLDGLQFGLFSNQQQLKILCLNNNMIKKIDITLFNMLISLEELYLNQNSLEIFDERCFTSLENLRILNLSNNNLRKLPKSLFQYQKRLIQLNLSENNFTEFNPEVLSQLHDLENFTFRKNKIETLDFQKLEPLAKLRVLDLSDCRIFCDCSAKVFNQISFKRSIILKLTCKSPNSQNYVKASEYLPKMDCSIVEKPSLVLFIILGLLSVSLLVDIFVSCLNYRYDLSTHLDYGSELVNEYEYVDNFKDLEEEAYKSAGVRNSGKHQSVLQMLTSVYEYLRPLPGRRVYGESYQTDHNPPIPVCTAPIRPQSNLYDESK